MLATGDRTDVFVVQFPADTAPTAQAAARRLVPPIREEWQPDGTWTGLFDVEAASVAADTFRERVETAGGEGTRIREIESEADIGGHRMALYAFD